VYFLVNCTAYPKNMCCLHTVICGVAVSTLALNSECLGLRSQPEVSFPGKIQCAIFRVLSTVLLKIPVSLDMTLSLDRQFLILPELFHCASVQQHPSKGPQLFCILFILHVVLL
jgi:hypothetical protein